MVVMGLWYKTSGAGATARNLRHDPAPAGDKTGQAISGDRATGPSDLRSIEGEDRAEFRAPLRPEGSLVHAEEGSCPTRP